MINKIKLSLLLLITSFFAGCSGLQVMIEIPQPEDDFVVECSWSSKYFSMHGGKSEVKRNTFVASSGEVVDCGTSWQGDGPSVIVSHPLYMGAFGCENRRMCDTPYSRMDDGKLIIIPVLKEKHLDDLVKIYKGEELIGVTRDRMSGDFPSDYLNIYDSKKNIDVEYFKKTYEERLIQYWNKLLPIIKGDLEKRGLRGFTVEKAINNYWNKALKYEK